MAHPGLLVIPLLISLGLPGLHSERCQVNGDQKPLEIRLLQLMIGSFNATATPNPSILIALRLAREHNRTIERALAEKLKEDAVKRVNTGADFSSGLVALYVMALQASCEDPRHVSALNTTIDLVQLLEEKYHQELVNIDNHQQPLTNYYQLGLDILALCLQNVIANVSVVLDTTCASLKYGHGKVFSVDTAAVVVLGLTCVKKTGTLTSEEIVAIKETLRSLVRKILRGKKSDGVIGNIYSTGLAMQALFVSGYYYTPSQWNCTQTLEAVLNAIPQGAFDNPPMAASQVTPSLGGRTYLEVKGLDCANDTDNLPIISPPTPPPVSNVSQINVSLTVVDGVTNTFNYSIYLTMPEGCLFLDVLNKAQSLEPAKFSFTVKDTLYGPYLVSINGLAAVNNEAYWQLKNGNIPLNQGIGSYKPANGAKLVAIFTSLPSGG
ncbi:transcobalamin-1-like [Ambystoma mexicanum]|uniref:transcobalamin-1-like n=1 Tax=Ambystoma mexicanum TaxID=8296 RepID=UPI0037E97510